jgi:hypothetical protein
MEEKVCVGVFNDVEEARIALDQYLELLKAWDEDEYKRMMKYGMIEIVSIEEPRK